MLKFILIRSKIHIWFCLLPSLFMVACSDHYAENDPKVGVPDKRYFNFAASANKSVRQGSDFLGGFTEFDQLDYEPTMKTLSEKYHIHKLSDVEKLQVTQLYQKKIASFAPWNWSKDIDITATTVVDIPGNYLILFVKNRNASGGSNLRLVRIQHGMDSYSPPVLVYGYTEESLSQERREDRSLHMLKLDQRLPDSAFVAGSSRDSSTDFSRNRYLLFAEQACSHLHAERSNMGELSIAVLTTDKQNKSDTPEKLMPLAKLPIAAEELPCWLNQDEAIRPVARRFLDLRTEYLTPEGVLLSVKTGYYASSLFKGNLNNRKIHFIWCANFVDCRHVMSVEKVDNEDIDVPIDDVIAKQASVFVGETFLGETALQVWQYQKQALINQEKTAITNQISSSCWRAKVEQEFILTAQGSEKKVSQSALKKEQQIFDFIADDKIVVVRKNIANYSLFGYFVTDVCPVAT